MTAVRRVRLPSLERIDRAVRELVATHGYVNHRTGLPAHALGAFPAVDSSPEVTVRQVDGGWAVVVGDDSLPLLFDRLEDAVACVLDWADPGCGGCENGEHCGFCPCCPVHPHGGESP
jgi:hypothetical protein